MHLTGQDHLPIRSDRTVRSDVDTLIRQRPRSSVSVEIPRIRKDSETHSNVGASTLARIRRESDRSRNESISLDAANGSGQRSGPNVAAIREVATNASRSLTLVCEHLIQRTKIYRMTPYNNPPPMPGPIASENKSLLLAAGKCLNRWHLGTLYCSV